MEGGAREIGLRLYPARAGRSIESSFNDGDCEKSKNRCPEEGKDHSADAKLDRAQLPRHIASPQGLYAAFEIYAGFEIVPCLYGTVKAIGALRTGESQSNAAQGPDP
jgi:hypothetical protein